MPLKPCLDCGALTRNGSRCGPAENNCDNANTAKRKEAGLTGHVGRHVPTRTRAQVIDEQRGRCARCQVHQDELKARDPKEFLEVHHIDGNPRNHRRANLEALCEDCHHDVERARAKRPGARRPSRR